MRPLQYFTDDYLEQCRKMKPKQVLQFLEDFRELQKSRKPVKSKLISIKIPEDLLESFKAKANRTGRPYQTLIKELMREWLKA
jgi:predicted DNA binding CopG/RHH family protein